MASLENKVIILTGSSSGIGAYTAAYLAEYKPRLVLVARRKDKLEEVAKKCQDKGLAPDRILVIQADLSVLEDIGKIVSETIKEFGQIDVLVNNAAAFAMGGVDKYNPQDFDKMFAVNVKAPMLLSQAAVPYLIETKGTIINISSTGATETVPPFAMYCASKAALDQFTNCLALELAPFKIRVNGIRPGFIVTEAITNAPPFVLQKASEYAKDSQPLKGVGECEDVAKVIKFLATEESSFITGDHIYVDGARHLYGPKIPNFDDIPFNPATMNSKTAPSS